MQNIDINANIKLHYIPMTKLKTTTIGVYIHRTLSKEDASYNALLPYVLKRGCKLCKNSEEISKYLENLYGASLGAGVGKRGDDQIIQFILESISDKYAPCKETILADMTALIMSVIFEPNIKDGEFDSDITEQEKNNAKDRIAAVMNDKRTYASMRCSEEMCKGEAFAISRLGTQDGIDSINGKALYDYYRRIITSSMIDIYVCGYADVSEIEKTVKKYTSSLEFVKGNIPAAEISKKTGDVKEVTERMDVTQGKLAVGFKTNVSPVDSDYPALMVMNSVFGSGPHSKLFNNVREKLSLAYYASSQLEKYKGLLTVNAGIEFENFQKAYDETLVQLKEIQNGNIDEYDVSIKSILNALESYKDDQRLLQNFYLGEEIVGSCKTIDDIKEEIKRVTVEDVVAVSKKLELDTVYFLAGKEEN